MNIGIANRYDNDRLAAAIRGGDLREFSLLLDQGVDVDCKEIRTGMTPLMVAVHPQHEGSSSRSAHKLSFIDESETDAAPRMQFVRTLLAKGADINLQDSQGKTVLMHAVHVHPLIIRELLASQPKLDVQDNEGDTALNLAAKMDRAVLAEILVNAGADATPKNRAEYDIFSLARSLAIQDVLNKAKAKTGSEAKVIEDARLKAERERLAAEAKTRAEAGAKAIETARLKTERERIAAETEAKADVGEAKASTEEQLKSLSLSKDKDDATALHKAAYQGDVDRVRALITAGADMNARNDIGQTALILAAAGGSADCVKALIAAGANVNENEGFTTALMVAAAEAKTACVKALIVAGANVNAKGNNGVTALILAGQGGNADCVNALIAAGADLNAQDSVVGSTALISAVSKGNTDCVKALIAGGADVNTKHKSGYTALDFAGTEHPDIVAALKAAGATSQSLLQASSDTLNTQTEGNNKMSIRDWFTPKWQNSDPEVRKSAIKRLTDRDVLTRMAKSDEDSDVRHIAKIRLIELQEGVKLDY